MREFARDAVVRFGSCIPASRFSLCYTREMEGVLGTEFFSRATLCVARELLGCFLCRKIKRKIIRLEIAEVEAYDGPKDTASHASCGQTARNAPMFGEAGVWYVYFTYGMHWMLNIVTGPKGYPAAVLIRGARLSFPSAAADESREISGPARLTKFLKIDKRFNNKNAGVKTGLWIEKGKQVSAKEIKHTPRIGVAYAGAWAKKPYRFVLRE